MSRFRCLACRKTFSNATFNSCYRQKKRKLNILIKRYLCSGLSQRRVAKILRINRKTVVRKLLFLAAQATLRLDEINRARPPAEVVQFDDLITVEHTKLKPLAATVAVEEGTRRILGLGVSRIPASGKLAKLSRKKYGRRKDERYKTRNQLFGTIKPFVAVRGLIKSDEEPHYPRDVKRHFPHCEHKTYRSLRACVAGQGELKRTAFDPIFSINHTLAMLRANVNRLFRRTWCISKRPDRLLAHLLVYAVYHNEELI